MQMSYVDVAETNVSLERTSFASAADMTACKKLLREGSKSFYAASLLLPKRVREPTVPVYAFCRIADDVVDESADPRAVESLHRRLEAAYQGAPHDSPVDRAFADVARRHRLPQAVMEALLEGFAWDAEGKRYATIEQLHGYCARVASTVGVVMSLLMGTRDPVALARACDLGVAMQLTNIARDVGEDARNGRVYLPLEWLDEAQVDVDRLLARPVFSDNLGRVVQRLLEHAETLYKRSHAGIPMLPGDCQASIHAASLIYSEIGRYVERNHYDSVSQRAYVPLGRKLHLLLRALWSPTPKQLPSREISTAQPLENVRFLVDACQS